MRNPRRIVLFIPVLTAFLLSGCAKDPTVPTTLEEQRQMAKGHNPTPEELKTAMSRFKVPGKDGAAPMPIPPSK